jgi:hypothetical protein
MRAGDRPDHIYRNSARQCDLAASKLLVCYRTHQKMRDFTSMCIFLAVVIRALRAFACETARKKPCIPLSRVAFVSRMVPESCRGVPGVRA